MSSGDPTEPECYDEHAEDLKHQLNLATEVTSKSAEIIKAITKLREELRQNLSQFHELFELKERIEIMLKEIKEALATSKECHRILDIRHDNSDVGRDIVEQALGREAYKFRKQFKLLSKEHNRVNQQLGCLRDIRLLIEADIHNKVDVQEKAECLTILSFIAKEIGPVRGPPRIPIDGNLTVDAWIVQAATLIETSQLERNVSQFLSIDVSQEMLNVADECFGRWYYTNAAFKKRMASQYETKTETERHLRKILEDIAIVMVNVDDVVGTLKSKMDLLHSAQTRVDERKGVSGAELCRDSEIMSLFKDIKQYRRVIDLLTPKYEQTEVTLKTLTKTKGKLERDLTFKQMSIKDKESCLYLRQSCPISTFSAARCAKPFSSFKIEVLKSIPG